MKPQVTGIHLIRVVCMLVFGWYCVWREIRLVWFGLVITMLADHWPPSGHVCAFEGVLGSIIVRARPKPKKAALGRLLLLLAIISGNQPPPEWPSLKARASASRIFLTLSAVVERNTFVHRRKPASACVPAHIQWPAARIGGDDSPTC